MSFYTLQPCLDSKSNNELLLLPGIEKKKKDLNNSFFH